MPVVIGSPNDRINRGIFCGPTGRASFGYFCFVADVIKPGGSQNKPTRSLPYSGDKFKNYVDENLKDVELTERQKRLLREDEEVLWLLKMFIQCQ
jgi:hypothetical protein